CPPTVTRNRGTEQVWIGERLAQRNAWDHLVPFASMLSAPPLAGAVLPARYWFNDGVTSRVRRSRPRRWLSRTVVEASVQSVAISMASPFTMRASSISACTVVAARRRSSPSLISEQRSRPPMSATKAFTKSRKRRAVAERPSRPGNRSLWFVTAERVREGNSPEGDDVGSITGRSPNIAGTYTRCEHKSSGTDQSCQKFLKRVGASSV